MKVLLSAFACNPLAGSEAGNGWNWAIGLANKGYEVHCLTHSDGKDGIESLQKPANLFIYYIELPMGMENLFEHSMATMYLYYLSWQWAAYKKAKRLHEQVQFDIVHHVSWGSLQMGSFMYKLNVPFIFGPAGGGQKAPKAFKEYFLQHWEIETKREKVSQLLLKFNPACKIMLNKAHAVLVSNNDSLLLAKNAGVQNAYLTLDTALPDNFFPKNFSPKVPDKGKLKLLWVGRLMPRKNIFLVLEVMNYLKAYPGITLTVIGDGELKNVFLSKVKQLDLVEKVNWMGKVDYEQVRKHYAEHDAFFFTSLRDSCPVQLIEAMAFGLPVVTIDLHGQSMIVNNETGFRCNCETPEKAIKELKEAILKLYNNPLILNSMSKAAYEFARKQNWKDKIDHITGNFYTI